MTAIAGVQFWCVGIIRLSYPALRSSGDYPGHYGHQPIAGHTNNLCGGNRSTQNKLNNDTGRACRLHTGRTEADLQRYETRVLTIVILCRDQSFEQTGKGSDKNYRPFVEIFINFIVGDMMNRIMMCTVNIEPKVVTNYQKVHVGVHKAVN